MTALDSRVRRTQRRKAQTTKRGGRDLDARMRRTQRRGSCDRIRGRILSSCRDPTKKKNSLRQFNRGIGGAVTV
jgi:hypothetical protein